MLIPRVGGVTKRLWIRLGRMDCGERITIQETHYKKKMKRGGLTVYEIYIGFCPRTDFFDIMHIACLVNDHFISNIDFLLTT